MDCASRRQPVLANHTLAEHPMVSFEPFQIIVDGKPRRLEFRKFLFQSSRDLDWYSVQTGAHQILNICKCVFCLECMRCSGDTIPQEVVHKAGLPKLRCNLKASLSVLSMGYHGLKSALPRKRLFGEQFRAWGAVGFGNCFPDI